LKRELLSVFLGVIVAFALVSLSIEPETNLRSEMPAAKVTYEGERIERADLIDEEPTEHYEYLTLPFSFLVAILVYQTSIRRLG